MFWVKLLHVFFMLVWVGSLLSLTRLLGYHVKLSDETQNTMAKLYWRMYCYVDLPSMVTTVLLGFFLLALKPMALQGGWFHLKLTLAMLLIICDVVCGKWIARLQNTVDHSKGGAYKILHGICGLLIIGILFSIYVYKPSCVCT